MQHLKEKIGQEKRKHKQLKEKFILEKKELDDLKKQKEKLIQKLHIELDNLQEENEYIEASLLEIQNDRAAIQEELHELEEMMLVCVILNFQCNLSRT